MRAAATILLITAASGLVGCASYPRAQNPFPGVFRVAVVDFSDKTNGAPGLSAERVTEIFASELQKVPTYEVVPVQEVREVLGPARIDTNQPQLAYELARAVHAQAIIVGSINEYSAHYPPRLALHCEMYAMVTGEPEAVVVSPPIELEPNRRPLADALSPLAGLGAPITRLKKERSGHHHPCGKCKGCRLGHRCDVCPPARSSWRGWLPWNTSYEDLSVAPSESGDGEEPVPEEPASDDEQDSGIQQTSASEFTPTNDSQAVGESHEDEVVVSSVGNEPAYDHEGDIKDYLAGDIPDYRVSVRSAIDPIPVVEPWVIRHSRVFDGTNVGLTRKLRDYHFFTEDLRGGEWQGYVHRNEDFVRFSCNQMIFEMLDAAGGNWITLRGLRIPQPWLPWPPR